jgi:hypothetical protein
MRIKSIKPGGWAPHRINSEPFAHLRQNNDKVISIHERRNCRWGSTLPELKNLEVSTYFSRKGTNFVHACDDMGIEVKHRRLYYNWLGLDFGHDARQPTRNGIGFKFLDPWEGERRSSALPPGTRLIRPRGASWVQFRNAFDREAKWWKHEKLSREDVQDTEKAQEAVLAKIFSTRTRNWGQMSETSTDRAVYDLNGDDSIYEPIYDDHYPLSKKMPTGKEKRKQRAKALTVTAKQFAKKLGVKPDDPRVTELVDKDGNIKHPFNLNNARGRIDYKMWKDAWDKEWNSILERKIFSERMTIEEARKQGITTKPVPCRTVNEIKRDPDGAVSKWKARFVVQGHPGHVTKGVHYWKTFSAAPNIATTRILQSCARWVGTTATWTSKQHTCGDDYPSTSTLRSSFLMRRVP